MIWRAFALHFIVIGWHSHVKSAKHDVHGIKVAVMGCEVNGPGEARDADIGVACFEGGCVLFKEGKPLKKISEDMVEDEIVKEALICMKDKEALNC